MNVELLSVGTELLLGDIVNTNVAFLAKELANIGINVYRQTVIGDNAQRLQKSLINGFEDHDIIITTGGLGPTDDDLTKNTIAKYFNENLIFDQQVYDKICRFLHTDVLSENNAKQAYVFENGIVLPNDVGTAPGLLLTKNNKTIILLPGPPKEMKHLFYQYVKPYLMKLSNKTYLSKYVRLFGIGESRLETLIKPLLEQQSNPTIALYAKSSEVLIRLTAVGSSISECETKITTILQQLSNIQEYIYDISDDGESDTTLYRVFNEAILNTNYTLSVCESLTGGKLSQKIVDQPGISKNYLGGIVAYHNDAKENLLGVSQDTLLNEGAVSEKCAEEMVVGCAKQFNSDIAIATTGIAGPAGGCVEKPIGLVYIGVYFKGKVEVLRYLFYGTRYEIQDKTIKQAMRLVLAMLNA